MSNLSITQDSAHSGGETTVEIPEKHGFSFQGSIDRTSYLFRSFLCSAIYFAVLARLHYTEGVFYVFLLLVLAAATWLQLATTVKRANDRGRDGIGACLVINILFLACLLIFSAYGRDWPYSTQYGSLPFGNSGFSFVNPVRWALITTGVSRLFTLGALDAAILLALTFAPLIWSLRASESKEAGKSGAASRASMPERLSWFQVRGRISNSAFATRVCLAAIAGLAIILLSEVVDHYWGGSLGIALSGDLLLGIAEPSIGGLSGFADFFLDLALLADLWILAAAFTRHFAAPHEPNPA